MRCSRIQLAEFGHRPAGGWLSVAGGGVERDLASDDAVLGGLVTLRPEQEWGMGRWWRTTNGPHFDFGFCVVRGEGSDAARPVWTGETHDAPGPAQPTPAEYRAILGE